MAFDIAQTPAVSAEPTPLPAAQESWLVKQVDKIGDGIMATIGEWLDNTLGKIGGGRDSSDFAFDSGMPSTDFGGGPSKPDFTPSPSLAATKSAEVSTQLGKGLDKGDDTPALSNDMQKAIAQFRQAETPSIGAAQNISVAANAVNMNEAMALGDLQPAQISVATPQQSQGQGFGVA